jgi:hypothetical protein
MTLRACPGIALPFFFTFYYPYFLTDLDETWYRLPPRDAAGRHQWNSLYLQTYMKFCPTFLHFFRPILTKFGREDVYKHLLSICKFRENRSTDGRTFLTAVNKITFKRIWLKLFFVISNEHFGKICVLCNEVHHLRFCYHHMTCYCYVITYHRLQTHLNSH